MSDARRELALEPGRYFVRGRAQDHLLEGSVELAAGERRQLSDQGLERVEYARLARKGGSARALAHGPFAGYALRSPLSEGTGYCQGARAGYAIDLPEFTLVGSLGACRASFFNEALRAHSDELSFALSARRVYDFPPASLGVGVNAGVDWLHQSFDTDGRAPARDSAAGEIGALVNLGWDLAGGFYLLAELGGELVVFQQQSSRARSADTNPSQLQAVFAWSPLLGVGKRF